MAKVPMSNRERTKALGEYGEKITKSLLENAGFLAVHNLNDSEPNHPFADYDAERSRRRFIISVRTRNILKADGTLNTPYNICKKGVDLLPIARKCRAELAWITIQVDTERRCNSAYFGTMAELNANGERYSVPMKPCDTAGYECLAHNQHDQNIMPEWTNQASRK
jgi:hypothetical protein